MASASAQTLRSRCTISPSGRPRISSTALLMFVEVINFLFEIISHSGRTEEDEYQPPNLPPPLSWESKVPGLRVGDGFTHAASKGSERAERGEEKRT